MKEFRGEIRLFTEDDVASALELCRQAGWNQLNADWRRLIRYQPEGCFAAVSNGKLAGTVTTTCFGTELAWIGMMLVDPNQRRRGIATRLMRVAIDYLRHCGVQCIKLDATPLGQTVYQELGFQAESTLHRWQGTVSGNSKKTNSDALHDKQLLLDEQAFGISRRELLESYAKDSLVAVKANAFGMLRPGYLATYLGPIVASKPDEAKEIVSWLLSMVDGDVFWDIFDQNSEAVAIAKSVGFQPVRELTRMSIGQQCVVANATIQYGIVDPAVG